MEAGTSPSHRPRGCHPLPQPCPYLAPALPEVLLGRGPSQTLGLSPRCNDLCLGLGERKSQDIPRTLPEQPCPLAARAEDAGSSPLSPPGPSQGICFLPPPGPDVIPPPLFVFLPFLGPLQRHMEVPRLGVESEL